MQQVCDETFWRNKFIREFGTDLCKYADKSYRDLYRKLSPLSDYELFETSIQYGYLPIIKSLIEENIIDIRKKGDKALRIATENGHLDIIKYLGKQGVDIHRYNDHALREAAEFGYFDVVKYLVENGADINVYNGLALRIAAKHGNLDIVKYLIEGPLDPKRPWEVGLQPLVPWHPANIHAYNDNTLFEAATNGHLDVVKYLIENGINIHAENDYALCLAVINGHLNIVKYLIEHGAAISDTVINAAKHCDKILISKYLNEQLNKM
jgi:ankyrin repeat protein